MSQIDQQRADAQSLSPLDGRYRRRLSKLADYMSEYSLMRHRVLVEVEWLIFLSREPQLSELPEFSGNAVAALRQLYDSFSQANFDRIRQIESSINHDVKSVEYFVKEQLEAMGLAAHKEFVHFACTSEDINNLSYALMLRDTIGSVWTPKLRNVANWLERRALEWRDLRMLAHTHGQAATPTTLGKELAVFAYRLQRQLAQLSQQEFLGKINGATGTFSAHRLAYPELDWPSLSQQFVESLGLKHNPLTTQIEPHDYMCEIFDLVARADSICTDLAVDLWLYISLGYFQQNLIKDEVGSSTMPHKINPIDFENAEANFGLANALLQHLSSKLPISRLQRDLSDSSTLRNIGSAIGYSCLALDSLLGGLDRLKANEAIIERDLAGAWEVISEGLQTVMRKSGMENPYELLKVATRGQPVTRDTLRTIVADLSLSDAERTRMEQLTPRDYVGCAADLVEAWAKRST